MAPFPGDDHHAEVRRLLHAGASQVNIGQGGVPHCHVLVRVPAATNRSAHQGPWRLLRQHAYDVCDEAPGPYASW